MGRERCADTTCDRLCSSFAGRVKHRRAAREGRSVPAAMTLVPVPVTAVTSSPSCSAPILEVPGSSELLPGLDDAGEISER